MDYPELIRSLKQKGHKIGRQAMKSDGEQLVEVDDLLLSKREMESVNSGYRVLEVVEWRDRRPRV